MSEMRPRNSPVTLEWIFEQCRKNGECLEWIRTTNKDGYGSLSYFGKTTTLIRVVYFLAKGKRPDGKSVLHSCDNRRCVNPAHLRLGSAADNAADRSARKRNHDNRGEKHPNSVLTAEMVLLARKERALGKQIKQLAQEMGIADGTLRDAVAGRTWSHLRSE